MEINSTEYHESNIFFETFLVTAKWSKLSVLNPFLSAIILFFGFFYLSVLETHFFKLENILNDTTALLQLIGIILLLIINIAVFIVSFGFKKVGALKIMHDRLLIISEAGQEEIFYKDVDEIRFERHSTFHKVERNGVPRQYGNKLFIIKNLMKSDFEFQLKSNLDSKDFADMMMFLRKKWPGKIVYTSI